ncbi:PH domain-containing protein [Streptomyces sp. NBC_00487]|uniref:PH domain-containing protein n=1 Tax=unclassified Streptomyces TaxID=2593676 RepID=UPI002E16F5C1|nr:MULTISPECIES: PH domain-containing protein [unclassified Streptomyces]
MSVGIEREYRKAQGVPPSYVMLVVAGGLICANTVWSMTEFGRSGLDWLVVVAWTVAIGRVGLEQWRARTLVTADGVTVRGALRTRTWTWSEIYGIRVEDNKRGTPRWSAYLYATDGRRARLHHLDDHQLTDPIAEVADLCATAVQLGLTSLETRPDVEERVEREARRRKAWQRTAIAILGVAAALFVFSIWLIVTDRPTHMYLLFVGIPLACVPVLFLALDRFGESRHRRLTRPATRTATGAPPG